MYSQNISFDTPQSLHPGVGQRKKWYHRWWGKVIIVFILLLLAMLVAMGFYVLKLASTLKSSDVLDQVDTTLIQGLATSDDPRFGQDDAKVVIVEFSDFQCPFCQQAMPVVNQIKKDYSDRVLFIYRDFPITNLHPNALLGAMGGACAHEQGGFWPMHDLIFANQDSITVANLKRWSVQAGLN